MERLQRWQGLRTWYSMVSLPLASSMAVSTCLFATPTGPCANTKSSAPYQDSQPSEYFTRVLCFIRLLRHSNTNPIGRNSREAIQAFIGIPVGYRLSNSHVANGSDASHL